MNPGPATEIATGFMESMKSQPLSLALCIMNIALLGIFYFILTTIAKSRDQELIRMHEEHKQVRELLARCVVPP
jgi:preprotein translocase subunit YajC